jgi:hypothetical protein
MNFFMIECNYNVIDLSIFVIYDVQYVVVAYRSKINWIFVFANHKWTTHILNALIFIFLGICFKKMCNFVNLLFKLNIYVHSSRFKNLDIHKMIYHHFLLNLSKIEMCCLLVYGGIIMKMDNSNSFEEVLNFLFYT